VIPSPRKPLRIAHLIESDGPGGAERIVADLAATLRQAGTHNVVFLPSNGEGWLARQLAGSGVDVEHYRLEQPLSPACARSLSAAFRRQRIDIAHSHEFSMAVYGAWASWRAGVPHVITMHGSRYYAGRLRRRLALRAAITRRTRMVAVSHQLADHISRDLRVRRSRIEMVSNGVRVAPAGRSTLRDELSLGPDDRLLVAIGNLYPVKGHRFAIEAVARLAHRHPTLHLAIAGRGDLDGALAEQARAQGVGHRVHLLGLRADVAAVLAAGDLFVLPSLSEGLPLALLEAMFAERAIVATDVGEVGAALDHGRAGVLVPPGDATALTAALDALLSDSNRARALAGRAYERAASEYDVANMVRRYRSMYDELLADAPRPMAAVTAGSAPPHS
jgi:glycosyltransferase involved in cell wall biosynthesis